MTDDIKLTSVAPAVSGKTCFPGAIFRYTESGLISAEELSLYITLANLHQKGVLLNLASIRKTPLYQETSPATILGWLQHLEAAGLVKKQADDSLQIFYPVEDEG